MKKVEKCCVDISGRFRLGVVGTAVILSCPHAACIDCGNGCAMFDEVAVCDKSGAQTGLYHATCAGRPFAIIAKGEPK